jgi:molybdopterin synthase catalytic subunit
MKEKKNTSTGSVTKKAHKVIQQGAISPLFIADSIAKHSHKTNIGAHTIFLGQVRDDVIDGKEVAEIDYTAYEEMAEKEFHTIREEAFAKYDLTCMHIYHSLGIVKAGDVSLFVFVSAKHREQVFEACSYIVEQIKKRVPIWGKELFKDGSYIWKTNTTPTDK